MTYKVIMILFYLLASTYIIWNLTHHHQINKNELAAVVPETSFIGTDE